MSKLLEMAATMVQHGMTFPEELYNQSFGEAKYKAVCKIHGLIKEVSEEIEREDKL